VPRRQVIGPPQLLCGLERKRIVNEGIKLVRDCSRRDIPAAVRAERIRNMGFQEYPKGRREVLKAGGRSTMSHHSSSTLSSLARSDRAHRKGNTEKWPLEL
jgi:hypothetical protein